MRAMINGSVCEVVKAYKQEFISGKTALNLETASRMNYRFIMSDSDADLALNQLYETGKLIGNYKAED